MDIMTEQRQQELIERLKKIAAWEKTYGAQHNVMLPASEAREIAEIALASLTTVKSPMMFIDGDISPESADKLAKVIQDLKPTN